MKEKSAPSERFSLSRWSRRKLEASAEAPAPPAAPANVTASATASVPAAASAAGPELPSIDSLKFDSDFTAFLRPEVDETLKRECKAAAQRLAAEESPLVEFRATIG